VLLGAVGYRQQLDGRGKKLTIGVRSLVLELASGWLWANFKLLILHNFLALVVGLVIADSKGLLGFGNDALCN
jgi:hypothetical protein